MAEHSGKYVAYYRVSTQRQGATGYGLEDQRERVKSHLNGGDWQLIGEFTEVESGKRSVDRHGRELRKALDLCAAEGATLVVAKLDRLTRNLPFLTRIIESRTMKKALAMNVIKDMSTQALSEFCSQMEANGEPGMSSLEKGEGEDELDMMDKGEMELDLFDDEDEMEKGRGESCDF